MSVLESNLGALAPGLARLMRTVPRRPDEIFAESRNGLPLNGLRVAGHDRFFHSRYEPRREAERVLGAAGSARFLVIVGAGVGYHVEAALIRECTVLLIEPDPRLLATALASLDFSTAIANGSLTIVAGEPDHDEMTHLISSYYVPVLHDRLAIVELPGRVAAEPDRFNGLKESLASTVERVKDDLATQARFGLRWTRNTIVNLGQVRSTGRVRLAGLTVAVAAAGPSLARALPALQNTARPPLVCADTALPVLRAHGVEPDLVVTIDCQLASYHHFLCAGSPVPPVAFELSSPPAIVERASLVVPLLSSHPLHTLLASCGLPFSEADVTGGNVTQSALDIVRSAGAREAVLIGADYSYPNGESYPRASYVHTIFAAQADRLRPLETLHHRFVAERHGVERRELLGGRTRWETPLLRRYASNLERYCAGTARMRVTRFVNEGLPLAIPAPDPGVFSGGQSPLEGPEDDLARESPGSTIVEPSDPVSPEQISGVLARARQRLEPIDSAESLRKNLFSPHGDSLAAAALRPLLVHLEANQPGTRHPDASTDADALVRKARDLTLRAIERACAMLDDHGA